MKIFSFGVNPLSLGGLHIAVIKNIQSKSLRMKLTLINIKDHRHIQQTLSLKLIKKNTEFIIFQFD